MKHIYDDERVRPISFIFGDTPESLSGRLAHATV
jgi:hypothetical protein